jgi:hypothetical protein
MKAVFAVVLCALAAAVGASGAGAYDRKPVVLGGFHSDGWYQTITNAEGNLHARYGGINTVYCVGIIMRGYVADSSLVSGVNRWWDKLLCIGRLYTRSGSFLLVFDQKAESSWTIYNLKGASIVELHRR